MSTPRINVSLKAEIVEELDILCKRENRSRANTIEWLIMLYKDANDIVDAEMASDNGGH